jgi:hypothetical protein
MSHDRAMELAKRRYTGELDGGPARAGGLPSTLIGYWEGEWEPGWPRAASFVNERWD